MSTMECRKKQVRFTSKHDIVMLREVVAQNPFQSRTKWAVIAKNISSDDFEVDNRRVRERTDLLVAKYKKEDAESRKRSGVDEDFDEKMVLLQEVVELIEEEQLHTQKKKDTKVKEEDVAKQMRKRALEGMNKDEDATPKAKKTNVMAYLKDKQEKEFTLKQTELQLRKEELQLQQQRFQLEKEERRQSLELQNKQNQMMMTLMQKMM